MGLDINKIANQMHCSQNEAIQRLKEDALLRAQYQVTEQELKELEELNGGVNWGKTMDEYAFNSTKASEYKRELPEAKKQNELAQARKRNNAEPSVWKTVGKYAGAAATVVGGVAAGAVALGALASAPAWAPLAVMGAGALLFTSCQNDIKAEQNQAVYVTIPSDKQKDYTAIINNILARLDNMENNQAKRFKSLLETLNMYINMSTVTEEKFDKVLNDIKRLLQEISDNQVSIQIDGNKNAAAILAALAEILAKDTSMEDKLKQVLDLLQTIKSIGENIEDTTKQILEAIENAKKEVIATLNTNNKDVLKAIENLNQNDQKTLEILNDIKALISKYGDQGKELAESILIAIGKINPGGGGTIDLSGIEAMLKQLIEGQKQTNDNVAKLTKLFECFSATTVSQLNTIICKLDKSSPDFSTQLDKIIKLLEKMDANNETRNQKILAAIDKLGVDISNSFAVILEAIQKNGEIGKGIDALLKQILANQETMIKDNKQGFIDVINAIKNISISGGCPDFSEILKLLEAIKDGVKNNGSLLKQIAEQNDTIIMILKSFKQQVGDRLDGIDVWLEKIYAKIPSGGSGGCTVDLTAVLNKLDEILAAIKKLPTSDTIKIDVTGKVTCNCCCGGGEGGGTHEGVIGNLDDLLG